MNEKDIYLLRRAVEVLRIVCTLHEFTRPAHGYDHPFGPNNQRIADEVCLALDKRIDSLTAEEAGK